MEPEQVNSPEDILNYIEGCLNDFELGITDKRHTVQDIADLFLIFIKRIADKKL